MVALGYGRSGKRDKEAAGADLLLSTFYSVRSINTYVGDLFRSLLTYGYGAAY